MRIGETPFRDHRGPSMGIHISRLLDVASYVSTECAVKSLSNYRAIFKGKEEGTNEVPATVILFIHLLSADRDVGSRAGAACKPKSRPDPPARPVEGFRQTDRPPETIQQFAGNTSAESAAPGG